MRNKNSIFIIAIIMLLLFAGCTLVHYAPFEAGEVQIFTKDANRPYKAIGLIHTEAWTWGFFYHLSPLADLGKAKRNLVEKARVVGADAVVNTKVFVVTRMPIIPFIFGYIEYHVSGTAIKYEK